MLARWTYVIEQLADDPLQLGREVDWVIKQQLIQAYMEKNRLSWRDPKVSLMDLQYHDIRPDKGLYWSLARRGLVDRITSDDAIERAKHVPPQTTRARLRGEFIRQANLKGKDYRVDWVYLKLNDPERETILCKDPFQSSRRAGRAADPLVLSAGPGGAGRLVIHADRPLARRLDALGGRRMVFLAGLPGTGKSLLVHQLAHVAGEAGRTIHLLQWDVARPVFEASAAGRRHPTADGVTHAVIRKAAGLWARRALVGWGERHPGAEHLLVGETPLVGNRFIELAQRLDDRAEPLLAGPSCRFVVAVPSAEVRHFLEAERERRAANPLHPREREDAPPHVLRDLWHELLTVAQELGITPAAPGGPGREGSVPYDPAVYQRVYETVLRHRNVEAVPLDVILPTEKLSVYDFAEAPTSLVPTEAEVEELIRHVERSDLVAVEREIAAWWQV